MLAKTKLLYHNLNKRLQFFLKIEGPCRPLFISRPRKEKHTYKSLVIRTSVSGYNVFTKGGSGPVQQIKMAPILMKITETRHQVISRSGR